MNTVKKIKIIATPPGFAPINIREAWIDVEIPMPNEEMLAANPPAGMRIGEDNVGGYLVRRHDAIEALVQAGKQEAVEFWNSLSLGEYLEFHAEVCSEIT